MLRQQSLDGLRSLRSAVLGRSLTVGTVKMIYDGPGES